MWNVILDGNASATKKHEETEDPQYNKRLETPNQAKPTPSISYYGSHKYQYAREEGHVCEDNQGNPVTHVGRVECPASPDVCSVLVMLRTNLHRSQLTQLNCKEIPHYLFSNT
ncbi:hypothetical protein CEXT_597181 [Caerostris extrusa]|uniref:Uncharacterized protein n=1 Tax=Caerostris extrusa TaxID=172846 RepID=A0AAV4S322_CAEEX|nr:hypothetical protein CEXT_597181 [Caerostris extrusa]